ncbi:MAG TPA: DNA-directed RNA polymerase subunit L [Candidatus Nanoarchaeia archaeon]|nr:DNA-directed RNA polymerase subunit L [Candidatus Nanoarchaeia archaeon]
MDINIVEEKKNRIVFQLKDQTHTFCNALKEELLNDGHVKSASYSKRHPLIGIPTMIVETDGEDTRKVLNHAVQRLLKECEKFEKEVSSAVR